MFYFLVQNSKGNCCHNHNLLNLQYSLWFCSKMFYILCKIRRIIFATTIPCSIWRKKRNTFLRDRFLNPFMPTGAFNICCPRDCVSWHNGGTRGSPIMPRDAVSRTANVERTGRHKWVKKPYALAHRKKRPSIRNGYKAQYKWKKEIQQTCYKTLAHVTTEQKPKEQSLSPFFSTKNTEKSDHQYVMVTKHSISEKEMQQTCYNKT